MNLSNLIGQNVLSYQGETIGYTRCPCFSARFKKVTALLCSDADEGDFFLPLSAQPNEGEPLLFTRKGKGKNIAYSPLGRPVYAETGKFLGTVTEMYLDDLSPRAIAVGEEVYPAEQITAFGDCILVNLRRSLPKATPRPRSASTANGKNKEPFALLGKKINSNVTNEQGEVLFRKGATVTPFTLKKAKRCNKTVELTAKTLPQTE
jgi:hypothetical protein